MTTRYCVFWIPSTSHKDPGILSRIKEDKTLATQTEPYISDDHAATEGVLETRINTDDEANKDITVAYRIPSKKIEKSIVLKYKEACRNGMLYYSYCFDETCPLEKAIDKAMEKAVYHLIKNYFHEHEYHAEDKDSLLKAFVRSEKVKIKECDNEVLAFYLKQFEKQLLYRNKLLREILHETEQALSKLRGNNKIEEISNLFQFIKNSNNYRRAIDDGCAKAIGFAIYAESLLKSWYNSNFHPHWIFEKYSFRLTRGRTRLEANNHFDEDAKRGLNRLAINIKRSISGIIYTKEKNSFAQQQDIAYFQHQNAILSLGNHKQIEELVKKVDCSINEGDKRAGKLWWIGIRIGLATCAVSILASWGVSSYFSTSTDSEIKELRKTIQQDSAATKAMINSNATMIESALSNDSLILNMIEKQTTKNK